MAVDGEVQVEMIAVRVLEVGCERSIDASSCPPVRAIQTRR